LNAKDLSSKHLPRELSVLHRASSFSWQEKFIWAGMKDIAVLMNLAI
jgi:hypothetical protein